MNPVERLETCASESEMGRNFADTPRACREAAATIASLQSALKRAEPHVETLHSIILCSAGRKADATKIVSRDLTLVRLALREPSI